MPDARKQSPTGEVGEDALRSATVDFTSDERRLAEAGFVIVAVPTPTRHDKTPDLGPIRQASATVGRNLRPGAIIVYESTVYPGATEDTCVPIFEHESGMTVGKDFLTSMHFGDRIASSRPTSNMFTSKVAKRFDKWPVRTMRLLQARRFTRIII